MKYFENITTLDELRKEYRRLCRMHHPDHGGNTATMQAINAEHDELFIRLRDQHNATSDEYHQSTETPEEFRAIIEALLRLDGLKIELCGSWLWIGGNTMQNKDALKAAGCRWSSSKKLWYWRHQEDGAKWSRGKKAMSQIRFKYGSQTFTTGGGSAALQEVC